MRGNHFSVVRPFFGVISLTLGLSASPALEADIIHFDPFKADPSASLLSFPPLPVPQDPALEDMATAIGPFVTPSLWGQQLVGFDLIQDDIDARELSPVTVYVADGGVRIGAHRKIEIKGEPYKARRFKLRISHSFKDRLLGQIIDQYNSMVPESIQDPRDSAGPAHPSHGSHVAGLIGSGLEVVGGARTNTIVDLDLFKGIERYRAENLVEGFQSVENEHPENAVLNLSVEVHDNSDIADALNRLAKNTDTVVVLASGNGGRLLDETSVASKTPDVLTVGAFGTSGSITSFSNYGNAIDLVAPGESIVSRGLQMKWRNETIEYMDGTSFAAPIVSAAAANIRAILPNASPAVVRSILTRTAIDLGLQGKDEHYGHGLVNAYRAATVAHRLARMGLTSKDAIEMAMTTEAIFNTGELERQAEIELKKSGFGTPIYGKNLRRKVLLNGKAEALESLGLDAMMNGLSTYGMGLMFASFNYSGRQLTEEELKLATATTWALQKARMMVFRDLSILKGLSNPDLIIASYDAMDPRLSTPLTPLFEERLLKAAPERLVALQDLTAEKAQKLLEAAPSVVVSTAP